MDDALVVIAATSSDGAERSHAATAVGVLGRRFRTRSLDLVRLGVTPAMTRAEREAYHSAEPLRDTTIAHHAELVQEASVIVFVFPTEWWTPPPILKAWLERTLVPGVSFVLDGRGRVAPNLDRLRAVAGITRRTRPDAIRAGGDGSRRMLLRTLRLNAPRRVRTAWVTDPTDERIESAMERL